MDALDLDVEDAVRIDIDAIVLFDVLRESFLAQVLDGAELLEERLILYVVVEQVELLRMTMPAAAADGRQRRCVMPFVLLLNMRGLYS